MLEGLEVSEIKLSDLENFGDISSEYYSHQNIIKSKYLRNRKYKRLSEISYITDGEHGTPDYDNDSNIKYVTAEHIRPNYILDVSFKTISSEQNIRNKRAQLQENDVLIYSVGAYAGHVAKAEKHLFPANIPRSVAIIRPNNEIKSEYLSVFLNSKFGDFQTKRFRAGNSQPVLALEKIKQFEIVILSLKFQSKISKIYTNAYILRLRSKELFSLAEEFLLKEVGLEEEIKIENIFKVTNYNVKSFKDSFKTTGRLDAEYYQKKYELVIEKIKSQNYNTLKSIVTITKSLEPGSDYYSDDENGLPFMRVSDFNKFGLSEPNKRLTLDFVNDNKDKIDELMPKKNTILFSKDGTVGIAHQLREDFNGITSSAILHLKVKNEKEVIPEYLTLALNSKLVQMQAERDAGGSIIQHWRKEEIENVVVPIIDYKKQKEIAELIEQSFSLKKQSEYLLEVAKQAVEIAIEENEEVAINFIETKLN